MNEPMPLPVNVMPFRVEPQISRRSAMLLPPDPLATRKPPIIRAVIIKIAA